MSRVTSLGSVGRLLTATLLALGLLALAACGMNVQTNKPYTPAEGVNVDVAGSGNLEYKQVVHVRNLGIISRTPGEGILSGSVVTDGSDALTGVSGKAIKTDGSDGSALTATIPTPVEVGNRTLVVLTAEEPLITFQSTDLAAGLDAVLTLQFRNAGQVTIRVPVLDGNQPAYASITPSASPTPSSTPSE